MHLNRSLVLAALTGAAMAVSATSQARNRTSAQLCSVGTTDVGQPGTLICKDVLSGATTQTIPVGLTASAAGGIGGSLSSSGGRVLVTNQVGGASLFRVVDGYLKAPVILQTGGDSSLSGALNDRGAYVLSGTALRFYPHGQAEATSIQRLLRADGSAAEVTLTDSYAYVSEKSGSLEAFRLGPDGRLAGPASPVAGIDAGVIVGITGYQDLVVSPIAHLASNAAQAEVPVVTGVNQLQLVATKEAAACWTANDDGEACVSNPGSMTVSCGRLGANGFESYTSDAASPVGEGVFDLDMRQGFVGIQAVRGGVPVLLTYSRSSGDFLTFVSEFGVGTAKAAGALLLPPLGR